MSEPSAGRARLPRWAFKAAAGLALALAILLAVELGLRALGPEPHAAVVVSADGCYFGWDALTFERFERPGLAFELSTDARGFRVEPGAAEPAARCALLAVGDSFTEGMNVSAAEAWPAALERQLASDGYSVRVHNGGMRGHTITHERAAALGRWRALEPRVVLVSHTANDLADLHAVDARCSGDEPATALEPGVPPLIARSRITRVTQDVAARVLRQGPPPALGPAECEAVAERYAAEARALIEGVARWGGRVVFLEPEAFHCGELDARELRAALRAPLEEHRGAYVDARSALEGAEASLRPLDSHPSATGHRRIAAHAARALLALGALDGCRAP